jgi:hypothetical protein
MSERQLIIKCLMSELKKRNQIKNLTVQINTMFVEDVLRFVIPCWLVERNIHFRGTCCPHLHYRKGIGP